MSKKDLSRIPLASKNLDEQRDSELLEIRDNLSEAENVPQVPENVSVAEESESLVPLSHQKEDSFHEDEQRVSKGALQVRDRNLEEIQSSSYEGNQRDDECDRVEMGATKDVSDARRESYESAKGAETESSEGVKEFREAEMSVRPKDRKISRGALESHERGRTPESEDTLPGRDPKNEDFHDYVSCDESVLPLRTLEHSPPRMTLNQAEAAIGRESPSRISPDSGGDPGEIEFREIEARSPDSGHGSPLEGAVGGEVANPTMTKAISYDDSCFYEDTGCLSEQGHYPGKRIIISRYLGRPVNYWTRPEHRRRHKAERQRRLSDGSPPLSDEFELHTYLQTLEPSPPRVILNQAGAIIGGQLPPRSPDISDRGVKHEDLSLVPGLNGHEHSIHSVETALIGEVYAGNYTPGRQSSSCSSRGLSPGSSFPSFSSRPPTDSDHYKMSPYPGASPEGDQYSSPRQSCASSGRDHEGEQYLSREQTDILESERYQFPEQTCDERENRLKSSASVESGNSSGSQPVRQRRLGVTQLVPSRSKSALAGSADYPNEELVLPDPPQKRKLTKKWSVCSDPTGLPERKISQDSSVGSSSERSEDDSIHPELRHSVESDLCLPMPDIGQCLAENWDALRTATDRGDTPPDESVRNGEPETEESESEPDPISVLSSSPRPDAPDPHPSA